MEVPKTSLPCNGADSYYIICPGASRGHPALLLCHWGTLLPPFVHPVGDGVFRVLESSKVGLNYLGRCLKEV